jgi:putative glutamine amidotransferase
MMGLLPQREVVEHNEVCGEMPNVHKPLVGITTDVVEASGRVKADVGLAYAQRVAEAGGIAVLLPAIPELADAHAALCDAVIFTGGDDPRMEPFGFATDPRVTLMHPARQTYEMRLLELLAARPQTPVLGVCLGMQLMTLASGGTMDQYMPDHVETHALHKNAAHAVTLHAPTALSRDPRLAWLAHGGTVWSNHKQAMTSAGRLSVVAKADDGVIEAIMDPARRFCVGVQWHPERTDDASLGSGVFAALVRACGN